VVPVVRLEKDDPVTRVEERHQGRGERPGRADRHDDVGLGVGSNAIFARDLVGDGAAERRRSLGKRVRAPIFADGGDRAVADERVRRQIADALPQVDPPDPLALARHSADLGLR
jgi:hypothetical protein